MSLLLLLACTAPTPDALLREGRFDEALSAWTAAGGRPVPARHATAQALAVRAPGEPWITMAVLVDLTEAAALLDGVPDTRMKDVDVSFERWSPMASCLTGSLAVPWRVAVGRSETVDDPDPHDHGLPFEGVVYRKGRVVGTGAALAAGSESAGSAAVASLFARLDADPPSNRVTLALTDPAGPLAINLTRKNGVWWSVSATNGEAAAGLVVRCGGG